METATQGSLTDVDTVVLIPMLGRAHRVAPVVDSIRATTRGARILFLCTPGDTAVVDAIRDVGLDAADLTFRIVPKLPFGDYARKINTGYRVTTEPLIFTGACDLEFHQGWLDAARTALAPGVGVVGTNDLGNPRVLAGTHATHFLITRAYIDQFGTIDVPGQVMHEGYPHEYVDDELVGTALMRGAFRFCPTSIVEHRHPNWCPDVPMDALYAQQPARMRAGQRIYASRRRRWTSPSQ